MKKIILFLCLISAVAVTQAQTAFNHTVTNPTGAILNTNVDTLTITTTKDYVTVGIQPYITRATGTQAGTAILSGSIDGVNYINTDTLTLTNAAINTTIWTKSNPVQKYWRIIRSGGTTVTGLNNATIIGRKPNVP